MEITFFVGNGFDLAQGLATRYVDFYNYVMVEEEKGNVLLSEDNIFLEKIREYIRKEKNIDAHKKDATDVDWANFEKALGEYTENLENDSDGTKYLDDLDEFREVFIDYIGEQERSYTVTEIEAKKMFEQLRLNFYKGIETQHENKILNLMKSKNPRSYNFNFVNFNYTKTLNDIIKHTKAIDDSNNGRFKCNTPIHVHRTLESGTFLGVNDVSQIAKSEVFKARDLNTIIKPELQKMDDSTLPTRIERLIKNTEIFFIYGMSMGSTDKIWWEKIADQILQYSNKYLIINTHVNKEEKMRATMHPRKKSQLKEKVENEFLQNLNLNEKQEKEFLSRTFVTIGSDNIFQKVVESD